MRCRILHESKGRMRVHLHQCWMSCEEADTLQYYLQAVDGVSRAAVSERTADAVIYYGGSAAQRKGIVRALSEYNYESCDIDVPEHTGRKLQHEYQEKFFRHFARRFFTQLFLPLPFRTAVTLIKAVPFVARGIQSLIKADINVRVLDAASVIFALVRGDFDTAGSVMFLLGLGDIIEDWTHRKSVDDLAEAMMLNVDRVWKLDDSGREILTGIDRVGIGDRIIVRNGNMIPLDGIIESGEAMINQASMTGEPLAVRKRAGSSIYAGTVVEEGQLTVRVTKKSGSGRYDRIVSMIEESEKLKSDTEQRASDLADRLVPITFAATGAAWLATRDVMRTYSVMMVDFCCALKLCMPIAVLSAMHEASLHNITVKGGKSMENFAEAETILFDKTGTLTLALPKVRAVVPFDSNDPAEMLRLAACLEEHYPHSIANAVVKEAKNRGLTHEEEHSKIEYVVAHGIASEVNGVQVRIGSWHFIFEDEGAVIPKGEEERFDALPDEYSHLYLAIGGRLSAVILIEDPIKEEAKETIAKLHQRGFDKIVMLTGDSERTAKAVAEKLGIDIYRSEVLPEDKAAFIEQEHALGRKVVMIGDGVNDTPALSAADVGIAINSGAAIAREIADITVSEDNLNALVVLSGICTALERRTKSNYRFILSFNSALIFLGVFGILSPTATALLHNTSTIAISLKNMGSLLPKDNQP